MRVLTIIELMRLSKIELCDLAAKITNLLPDFPEGSAEREVAHQPAQHPDGLSAARLFAVTRAVPPPPVRAGRRGQWLARPVGPGAATLRQVAR
jgi:hypothetical protein